MDEEVPIRIIFLANNGTLMNNVDVIEVLKKDFEEAKSMGTLFPPDVKNVQKIEKKVEYLVLYHNGSSEKWQVTSFESGHYKISVLD